MGKKRTLLRTQRKQVFQMLRAADLEPGDFDWSRAEVSRMVVSRLGYREGEYYFQFSSYEMGAACIACPGRSQLVEYDYPKDWAEQVDYFHNWAAHLKRELACRDPWVELEKYRIAVGVGDASDGVNETISGLEAREIGEQLGALGAMIEAEFGLSDEQTALVRARLTYLAEAAMRQKSRDWVFSALGVCVTLAMALSLGDSDAARLWGLIKERVGAFVRLSDWALPRSAAGS